MDSRLFELEDALQQITTWSDDGQLSFPSSAAATENTAVLRSNVPVHLRPIYDGLLTKEKELIEAMKIDIDTYLNNVYQVADLKTQTKSLVGNYRSFIEKHVLWIRSSEHFDKSDFKEAAGAFHWLVNYNNWRKLGMSLTDLRTRPWWSVLFLIGFSAIVANHTRMRRRLSAIGDKAAKRSTTSFSLTTQSLLLTVAISLPVPMVLLFLHWRLEMIEDAGELFAAAWRMAF